MEQGLGPPPRANIGREGIWFRRAVGGPALRGGANVDRWGSAPARWLATPLPKVDVDLLRPGGFPALDSLSFFFPPLHFPVDNQSYV